MLAMCVEQRKNMRRLAARQSRLELELRQEAETVVEAKAQRIPDLRATMRVGRLVDRQVDKRVDR
jgi:hypothetical protein